MVQDARRWFVTGASAGLGRALAKAALARGDAVAGTSRSADPELELATLGGARWLPLQLDLRDAAAASASVDEAARRLGGLDIVVNNAGYALAGPIEDTTPVEAEAQMAVNFLGAFFVIRAALPYLRRSAAGRIINIASLAAVQGFRGLGFYSASKHALAGLSEALAQEVGGFGVKVTIVEPSGFRTGFAGRSLVWTGEAAPEYAAMREALRAGLERSDGAQPNDPAKGAAVLLNLADMPDPPLHFPLGHDATDRIVASLESRLAEYRRHAGRGSATDFPT